MIRPHKLSVFAALAVLALALFSTSVCAQSESTDYNSDGLVFDGFTEPFRRIDLSSDEAGAITSIMIEEGDRVDENDVVVVLDNRVQKIQLEIATKMAHAQGQRAAAAKTLEKRKAIAQRLDGLQKKGHASPSELFRAELELSIAESRYDTAVEDAAVREIERKRAQVQLDRRTIHAPFAGYIAKIHRREGEFLSPLHPQICTVIQVDRLLASFNIPSREVNRFVVGESFDLRMSDGRTVTGVVHHVSVETNPQSGTVEVKLVIDNRDLRIRSGDTCTIAI